MRYITGIVLLILSITMTGCYRTIEPTYTGTNMGSVPDTGDGHTETIYRKFFTTGYCTISDPAAKTESLSSGTAYDLNSVKYSCKNNTEAEFGIIDPKTETNKAFVEEIVREYKPAAESVSAEYEKVVKLITSDVVMILWYDDNNVYLLRMDRQILDTEPNGMQQLLDSYLEKYPSDLNRDEMNNYINNL